MSKAQRHAEEKAKKRAKHAITSLYSKPAYWLELESKERKTGIEKKSNFAAHLAANATAAERRLHDALISRMPYEWEFQYVIHPYIADFFHAASSLVVEVDGLSHANSQFYDNRRDAYLLKNHGIRTLRVSNEDVLTDLARTLLTIMAHVRQAP